MSVTNSESSDLNNTPSVSDNNETIEGLSRSLRLAKRDLERELIEEINDCGMCLEFGPSRIFTNVRKLWVI